MNWKYRISIVIIVIIFIIFLILFFHPLNKNKEKSLSNPITNETILITNNTVKEEINKIPGIKNISKTSKNDQQKDKLLSGSNIPKKIDTAKAKPALNSDKALPVQKTVDIVISAQNGTEKPLVETTNMFIEFYNTNKKTVWIKKALTNGGNESDEGVVSEDKAVLYQPLNEE